MRGNASKGRVLFALTLAILGMVALVVWWKWDQLSHRLCQPLVDQQQAECKRMTEVLMAEKATPGSEAAPLVAETPGLSEAQQRWAELMGTPPRWPEGFPSSKDCDSALEDLLALCHELESRPYLQGKLKRGGCYTLMVQASEALAAHPPVASGELLRYESLLANVFHFFRVLGRDRVHLLREILSREQALAEPLAMALFGWLSTREQCEQKDLRIRFRTLYDYAAFFLNTVGGQVYLRRRSPKIAGLVSFYALVILDLALQKGINPHGVDIRPHIPHCRELLNRPDLIFKDQYLEILREMEKRWGSH